MKTVRALSAVLLTVMIISAAHAAPAVKSDVVDVIGGVRSALSSLGFTDEMMVSALDFATAGTSVALDAASFPGDSTLSSDPRVASVTAVSGADHVVFASSGGRMALRLDTLIPMDALPDEFQHYVTPAWDCESQARYLDSHGYVLVQTYQDGAASRDRVLIGPRELGAMMTWLEARATGITARHLNGGVQISLVAANEDRASYTIDTGLREYSDIEVTGEMPVITDGVFDDRIDSRLWTAVVKMKGADGSSGSGGGGCSAALPLYAAALAAVAVRRWMSSAS